MVKKLLEDFMKKNCKRQSCLLHNSKIAAEFEENCLKQDKISFTQGNVVTSL